LKFFDFFNNSPEKKASFRLYKTIVTQSRTPGFYLDCGVPDTVDGRFDMIALHTFLVLHRLKKNHTETSSLNQALFDLLFADMDQNLREMGVGDLSVGKKIKKMTAAFQGRLVAYENALQSAGESVGELEGALKRNLFRHVDPDPNHVKKIAQYVLSQVSGLEHIPTESLSRGDVAFESFITSPLTVS
jgi:cytochrome b pre-mRNA-processing protein 3